LVMKLFEQNVPRGDEFTQWCSKALSGLQSSVDSEYFFDAMFSVQRLGSHTLTHFSRLQ
jgi:PERQ amino acid-rich with GYF domain-containing protein